MNAELQAPPTALTPALAAALALADPAAGAQTAVACEQARRARDLAAQAGRPIEQGRATAWLCTHLHRLGRYADVLVASAEAALLLDAPELQALRRETLRVRALAGCEAGVFDAALDAAHELVRITPRDDPADDGAPLTAATGLAVCFERMGDPWQAVRLLTEAIAVHRSGEPERPDRPLLIATNGLCATLLGLMHRLMDGGDRSELDRIVADACAAARRCDGLQASRTEPHYEIAILGNLGEATLYAGDLQAAGPMLQRARERALELGLQANSWRVQASLGAWQLARGEPAAALEAMHALIREMGDSAPPQTAIRAHHAAYRACRALGRFHEALEHFEVAERLERHRTMAQLRAQSALFVTRTEAQQAQWQAQQARLEAQVQRELAAEAAAISERDPLTGLGNRRHFERRCDELLPVAQRLAQPMSLALIDIDHFKDVNDAHGHATGDRVLKRLAQLLRENTRSRDVLARHGGEEFVVLLPGMPAEQAAEVCERLRERVESELWRAAGADHRAVTISVGLAAAGSYDAATLLQRADEALYQAKRAGRNRLCRADS